MLAQTSTYKHVIQITADYLGPASHRFIDRQIKNHLHKEPEELQPEDIPTLVDWAKVAIALLTDDTEIVEEYIERMSNLGKTAA